MDTEHRASIAWQVFEESNDAIIVTDNDNKIIDVNPFTQRVTQYRRSELLAMTLFDVLDGGDRTVDEMISALRETGVFHSRESFELRCNHGIRRHVNISVSRLHISQQVFGVVIARDITERVANQEALKAANEELEKRVVQRTAE